MRRTFKQVQGLNEGFRREMGILCKIAHPHVIRTFGACMDDAMELMVIMELAERGTLRDLLKARRATLTNLERIRYVQ